MGKPESVTTPRVGARWEPGACPTQKRAFRAKQDAKRALKKSRSGRLHKRLRGVYLCRCGSWHLTSQKQRTAQ